MSDMLKKFDDWFEETTGPAALVIREYLLPVEDAMASSFRQLLLPATASLAATILIRFRMARTYA